MLPKECGCTKTTQFTMSNPTGQDATINFLNTMVGTTSNIATPTLFNSFISVSNSTNGFAKNPTTGFIYVASVTDNSVYVLDPSTNATQTSISVGTTPAKLAYCSTTNSMYVTCTGSNDVYVINCTSNTVSSIITGFSAPTGICYAAPFDRMYVLNSTLNQGVGVITCSTATLLTTITLTAGTRRGDIVYNTNNDTVYVKSNTTIVAEGRMCIVNPDTNTETSSVLISDASGGESNSIAFVPNLNNIYIANNAFNTIRVFDCSADTLTTSITLSPVTILTSSISYNATSNVLYIGTSNPDDSLLSYNLTTSVQSTIYTLTTGTIVSSFFDSVSNNIYFSGTGNGGVGYVTSPIVFTGAVNYTYFATDNLTLPKAVCYIDVRASNFAQLYQDFTVTKPNPDGSLTAFGVTPSDYVSSAMPVVNSIPSKVHIPFEKPVVFDGYTFFQNYIVKAYQTVTFTLCYSDGTEAKDKEFDESPMVFDMLPPTAKYLDELQIFFRDKQITRKERIQIN
jgi:YVTN family beta-propeller protein